MKHQVLFLLIVQKKTILQCDASKNGLGCCLFQEHNKILKLVACVSRSMNDHEVHYSQIEKELLAISFGANKFLDFIYRMDTDVQTDHKPLISIMKKPIFKIGSVRLQRLRLKLLKYTLNVYYVPGKEIHFVDMLSRSSLKTNNNVARRNPVSFKKGDNVVVRTNKEKVWYKAVILERAKEPRSYWVKKESSGKIMRRNTSQIKMSLTKSESKVLTEPELFPNTSEHNNVLLRNNNDLTNVTFSGISPLKMNETDDRVSVCNHSRSRASPILEPCSRFGRPIRAPRRLNL